MRMGVSDLARVAGARLVEAPAASPEQAERWCLSQLAGRLVELSGGRRPAELTAAFGLVAEAQHSGDRAAWITLTSSSFFAPDVAAGGIDLGALPVVRVPDATGASRAADYLVRSNGFGLVVMDLAGDRASRLRVPVPVLTRLVGLARTHETTVVMLTRKSQETSSLNSLISLRAEASLEREDARCDVSVQVLKDKRRGPGWRHLEVCRGSVGLR